MTTTIDDLLAEIAPREKVARILLRQDMLAEHARLDSELEAERALDATENRDPVAPGLANRLLELEAEIEAAKRDFRFRSIGKKAWADLLSEHPPTKDQAKANTRIDHNPETFPLAAIAASCVDPVMTVEQVDKLEQLLTIGQFETLWGACIDANIGGGVDRPKSLAAGLIARVSASFESSAMAMDAPSRGQSSSAE
jgi:hypothetical protein